MSEEELIQKREKEALIKKQAADLEQKIKDASKELEELQKSCQHPKELQKIKDVGHEGGTAAIRKICGLCSRVLGYPSKDELIDWTGIKEKTEE